MDDQPRIETAPIPAWIDGALVPADKLDVHRRGIRHKAVSVFVVDAASAPSDPGLLLQRRAAGKYHSAGLWANACCTHPLWGEGDADCARRRLGEELGLSGVPLAPAGSVEYRADVGGGMVEHEVVAMFVGSCESDRPLAPDPSEVMETRWQPLSALETEIAASPERFTPWLRIYLAEHRGLILARL